ncbi:MAG: peptidoglycan-binding domain-containing protein [Thermodesulfobacteriota bacterium]
MAYNFTEGLEHFRQLALAPQAALHAPDEMLFNSLTALRQDFDLAGKRGIFNPLPEEEPPIAQDAPRLRTIRSRLAGLGYLRQDAGLLIRDPLLIHAIKKFQQDAGLTTDGWVGRQTWQALQELVSFERQGDIGRWFIGNNSPCRALERAIALRLQVLGLTDTPAGREPAGLAAGLRHLQSVAAFLQLPGKEKIRPEVCPATIALLFDQDLLVEGLAAGHPLPNDADHPLFAFAACMAKVELWLAGYEVTPNGYEGKEFFRPTPQILLLGNDSRLFAALAAYWRDHGKKEESPLLAQRFAGEFPAFFRMIAAAIRAGKGLAATEKSAMISRMAGKQPEQLAAIWQTALSLGGRLWDGLGRTAGWFHNLTRQPGGKMVGIGRNISRLVYHQAMTAFALARQALQDFPELLDQAFARESRGSDPRHIMMRHDRDLAFKVYVNPLGDPAQINQFLDQVSRTAASFAAACRIIALCLSTLHSVVSQGRTGWAGLILALLQVSDQIMAHGRHLAPAPDSAGPGRLPRR